MEIIRTVIISNGAETRELELLRRDDGSVAIYDMKADPNMDSAETIADDSDSSVMDVIRDNGFEIIS